MCVRDGQHAPTTIPQLDFVSGSGSEVHVEVSLERKRLDAVDFTVMCSDHLELDIFKFLQALVARADCRNIIAIQSHLTLVPRVVVVMLS